MGVTMLEAGLGGFALIWLDLSGLVRILL